MSTTTENVTRTAWASMSQACMFADIPLTIYKLTTINERLGILPEAKITNTEYAKFGWWTIGDQGHRMSFDGNTNNAFIDPEEHERLSACVFNTIPFVLRQEANDLTEKERQSYGLRRMEEHNGIKYFAYYAKVVDMSKARATMRLITIRDGKVIEDVEFEPDSAVIYPERKVIPPDQGVITDTRFAEVRIPVLIDFTEQDVQELINVAGIIYKNEKQAIISEIGLVTGIRREVTIDGAGGKKEKFNEVVHAQTAAFISTYQQMNFSRLGFLIELEIGSTEPLQTGIARPIESGRFRSDLSFSGTARLSTR